MWKGGELQFQFTDFIPGPVIINFFDTLASPPIMWSKNGEPVLFEEIITSLVDKFQIGPNPAAFDGNLTAYRMIQLPNESSPKQQTGQIFELVLKRRILNENNQQQVQAWVTVFDAVGHVLVNKAQMGMDVNDTSNTKLAWVWNGKNLRGMQAAGGTYLARYVVKAIIDGEVKREERGSGKVGIKTVK
jgi:hypothetical protein